MKICSCCQNNRRRREALINIWGSEAELCIRLWRRPQGETHMPHVCLLQTVLEKKILHIYIWCKCIVREREQEIQGLQKTNMSHSVAPAKSNNDHSVVFGRIKISEKEEKISWFTGSWVFWFSYLASPHLNCFISYSSNATSLSCQVLPCELPLPNNVSHAII